MIQDSYEEQVSRVLFGHGTSHVLPPRSGMQRHRPHECRQMELLLLRHLVYLIHALNNQVEATPT